MVDAKYAEMVAYVLLRELRRSRSESENDNKVIVYLVFVRLVTYHVSQIIYIISHVFERIVKHVISSRVSVSVTRRKLKIYDHEKFVTAMMLVST